MGSNLSQQNVANISSEMVADILVKNALQCNGEASSVQSISVRCQPKDYVAENSGPCRTCLQNQVDAATGYYTRVRRLWQSGNLTPGIPLNINDDFQNIIVGFQTCGYTSCKSCNVQDYSQSSVIKTTQNCKAFNEIQNTIVQSLQGKVQQYLANNQDVLSPLASLFGANSEADVVTNVVSRLRTKITNEFVNTVSQHVDNVQVLVLGGDSVADKGHTQKSAFTAMQDFMKEQKTFNDVLSEAEVKVLQNNINDQTTLNSVGDVITKSVSAAAALFSSLVGQAMIFCLIVCAVIALCMIMFVIVKLIQKAIRKNQDLSTAVSGMISQEGVIAQ